MKSLLARAAVLAALGACHAAPPPEHLPDRETWVERRVKPEEIVALVNGEPVTWQAVAETVLELNLKDSIDQYVRWKIVEDRSRALSIAHTPEELRRRAGVYLEQVRTQVGDERFRRELSREGVTLDQKRAQLEESRFLSQLFTLDKLVRFGEMREDQLQIDRVYFAEQAAAERFHQAVGARGWDAAVRDVGTERGPSRGRLPREAFSRSHPPTDPALDPEIVGRLAALSPGDATGVETSRSNLYYVVRLLGIRKGRNVVYSDVREEVLESILSAPPAQQDYARWMERELAQMRVEYRGGGPRREGTRPP